MYTVHIYIYVYTYVFHALFIRRLNYMLLQSLPPGTPIKYIVLKPQRRMLSILRIMAIAYEIQESAIHWMRSNMGVSENWDMYF